LAADLAASAEERIAQQLIEAGYPEAQARRVAAAHVARLGPAGGSAFADRNTMGDRPNELKAAAKAAAAADARHAQMQDDYFAATGMPGGRPPAPDMSEFDVMQGDTPGTERRWNARTGQYDTVRTGGPGLGRPEVSPEDESREKETKALYDNIKMKYGESEAEAWLASRNADRVYVPRYANQIKRTDERRALEQDAASGGAGAIMSRALLHAADDRYTENVSVPRWIREAGLNPDDKEVQDMTPGALRLQAAEKRMADKQARELQWRAQLMMNRGNYAGALALPGMDDAMKAAVLNQQNAVLNARREGGPINFGPNPLGVQAIQNELLTRLGLDTARGMATGRGFQQPPQEVVDANLRAAEDKRRQENPEASGNRDLAEGQFSTREAQLALKKMAEEYDTGGAMTGGPEEGTAVWWMPGVGAMSVADEDRLMKAIKARHNVSDAVAASLAREAANSRRRGPLGGDWGMRPLLPMPEIAPAE
jgi:hypothetical protein